MSTHNTCNHYTQYSGCDLIRTGKSEWQDIQVVFIDCFCRSNVFFSSIRLHRTCKHNHVLYQAHEVKKSNLFSTQCLDSSGLERGVMYKYPLLAYLPASSSPCQHLLAFFLFLITPTSSNAKGSSSKYQTHINTLLT